MHKRYYLCCMAYSNSISLMAPVHQAVHVLHRTSCLTMCMLLALQV
jgi:hypothetical protein